MKINPETYYIVRGAHSGVFAGNILEQNGREVKMANVRCLWRWCGAATILQLATEGVKNASGCKFTMVVPEVTILDAIEVVPCTETAKDIIMGVPEWKI